MITVHRHMPHVDSSILLPCCYNLLQFDKGNYNSQGVGGGGEAISVTKMVHKLLLLVVVVGANSV